MNHQIHWWDYTCFLFVWWICKSISSGFWMDIDDKNLSWLITFRWNDREDIFGKTKRTILTSAFQKMHFDELVFNSWFWIHFELDVSHEKLYEESFSDVNQKFNNYFDRRTWDRVLTKTFSRQQVSTSRSNESLNNPMIISLWFMLCRIKNKNHFSRMSVEMTEILKLITIQTSGSIFYFGKMKVVCPKKNGISHDEWLGSMCLWKYFCSCWIKKVNVTY